MAAVVPLPGSKRTGKLGTGAEILSTLDHASLILLGPFFSGPSWDASADRCRAATVRPADDRRPIARRRS